MPISHGFNTIPHFSALVVALGTLLAWTGGHIGLVLALVTGFSLTRGLPNAAELIIFFFAAPDPVTVPRSALGRAAFGLAAGLVTGLLWTASSSPRAGELGRQLLGNELIKVGGLVVVGVLAALFGRSLQASALARWLARPLLAAASSSALVRGAAAAALLAYAAVVDRGYPFHANDIEIRIVDTRSGRPLGARASEAFHRREIFVEFGGDQIRGFWSALQGGWSSDYVRQGGAHAAPGTDIAVHLVPACRPDLVVKGPPYIRQSRSLPLPKAGPFAAGHKYLIVVPVDVGAVMSLCGSAAGGGRS